MRKIKRHLQDDRRHWAAAMGASITGHLEGGDLAEAWRCLNRWYAVTGERPPKPCHETMVTQTAERVEIQTDTPSRGTHSN